MPTQKRTFGNVLASIVVGLVIAVAVAGGSYALNVGATQSQDASSTATSSDQTSSAQVETHEIVDCVGRTVTVPTEPQHMAALDSFSGSVCILAGAGDRLMGAPGGVISNQMLAQVYSGTTSLTQLSGDSINAEELLSAGVDVVFVKEELYSGSDETDKLDQLGIPYVVVSYSTVEEQMDAIGVIGEVCGGEASTRAQNIEYYYRSTVELVEERAAQVPEDQRKSVYHSINDPLLTDGEGSLGSDWITRTGAIDVSSQGTGEVGSGDYTATLEQVYAWDPDVVICNSLDAANTIRTDAQWQGLDAVSSGQVYNIPVSTSRWGQRGDPETFLGMLWLGKTLYPDLYTDIDLKETVVSYYRDIIGIEIDDETWDAIVAGEGIRVQGNNDASGL